MPDQQESSLPPSAAATGPICVLVVSGLITPELYLVNVIQIFSPRSIVGDIQSDKNERDIKSALS